MLPRPDDYTLPYASDADSDSVAGGASAAVSPKRSNMGDSCIIDMEPNTEPCGAAAIPRPIPQMSSTEDSCIINIEEPEPRPLPSPMASKVDEQAKQTRPVRSVGSRIVVRPASDSESVVSVVLISTFDSHKKV